MLQTTTYKKTPNFFGVDYTKKGIATKVRINYTTFGSPMPGRSFTSTNYKYGFNGMEKDDEIKGNGNSLDYGARMYDSRLGRWLSIDPLQAKYPDLSVYNFSANNPILFIDNDGKKFKIYYETGELNKKGNPIIKHVTIRDLSSKSLQDAIHNSGGNEFVKNVVEAISYVKPADTEYHILDKVAEAKRTIKIKELKGEGTSFTDINNTVKWNPTSGLNVENEGIYQGFQSPALGLYHEVGHAFRNLFHKLGSLVGRFIPDKQHTNKDEKINTGKYEASVAGKLDEPVRDRYDGGSEVLGKKVTESENRHIVKPKNEKK